MGHVIAEDKEQEHIYIQHEPNSLHPVTLSSSPAQIESLSTLSSTEYSKPVMSTSISELPIVSLSALSSSCPKSEDLQALASRLDEVFSTTGFAYLTDLPIPFSHDDIFQTCDEFFTGLSLREKMQLAKKTFVRNNKNTYRGYARVGFDNKVPAD